MDLLIDTQALVWTISGDRRLSAAARALIGAVDNTISISAVTAFEFVDLEHRGRLPPHVHFAEVIRRLGARLLDFPAEAWHLAVGLEDFHRDPVDRMLIAHAIHADLILVTADATMRRYPVKSVW